MQYEYKVVPAPAKGQKAKGVRGAADRFAHALELLVNRMAAEGWDYIRCDTLPSEERAGLTQTQTVWRNLLVFRRPVAVAQAQNPPQRRLIAPPAATQVQPTRVQPTRAQPTQAPAQPQPQPEPPRLRAVGTPGTDTGNVPNTEQGLPLPTAVNAQDLALQSLPGPLRARALRLRAVQNG